MLELNVPQEYLEDAQQLIGNFSIPVTDETFHDQLVALIDSVRNGAKEGLDITVYTFEKTHTLEQNLFMPEIATIKHHLQRDNTALMVSDKNGAVFCLNYIQVGDQTYLQFLNPEAARFLANKERELMESYEAPAELSFFEKICDALSRFFLDHPTEAGARRDAYRAFYENMQKNTERMEHLTTTRPAEEYGYIRQQRIQAQQEALRQAEQERLRLEEEARVRAEQERLAAEERERLEEAERQRKAQFENLDKPEDPVEPSAHELEEDRRLEEEQKAYWANRENQIKQWNHEIENAEFELKQIPRNCKLYDGRIKEDEEKIKANAKILENDRGHEKKLLEKITQLDQQIEADTRIYESADSEIEDLINQYNLDKFYLSEDKKPVDKCKDELDAAQAHFDAVNEDWEEVEHEHSMMTMDPRTYLAYMYQLSKSSRDDHYQEQQRILAEQIRQQEEKIKVYKEQMRPLKTRATKNEYNAMGAKLAEEENLLKAMKNKVGQIKKDYELLEKEHQAEFLSPSAQKLEETRLNQQLSYENYERKRAQHDQALRALNLTKETYQGMLNVYQQKDEAFRLKWETLNQQKQMLQDKKMAADGRLKIAKEELDKLHKVYDPLKIQNDKAERTLKSDRVNLQGLREIRAKFDTYEPKYRQVIDRAKEELRKLGAPVPGEENEKQQEVPVVKAP